MWSRREPIRLSILFACWQGLCIERGPVGIWWQHSSSKNNHRIWTILGSAIHPRQTLGKSHRCSTKQADLNLCQNTGVTIWAHSAVATNLTYYVQPINPLTFKSTSMSQNCFAEVWRWWWKVSLYGSPLNMSSCLNFATVAADSSIFCQSMRRLRK